MPPTKIYTLKGLHKFFDRCSDEVRSHFEHLPHLVDQFPYAVGLAYMFHRLELGQNMALYCGVVKLHRANSTVAKSALNSHHMTRAGFADLYRTIFDIELPREAKKELRTAENIRDTIMHGGKTSSDRTRNAIARVLEFAEAVNKQLNKECSLEPFAGYWRGFAGRSKKLDPRTTRFMLKGMGFSCS